MNDFNIGGQARKFIKSDPNKYTKEEIVDAFKDVAADTSYDYKDRSSIFSDTDGDGEINCSEFMEMMGATSGLNADEDDYQIIFDVLSAGSENGTIDPEVLKFASVAEGGKLTKNGLWATFSESAIEDLEATVNGVKVVSVDGAEHKDDEEYMQSFKSLYGEDSQEYADLKAGKEVNVEVLELTSSQINSLAEKIANGDATLDVFEGLVTAESYEKLSSAVKDLAAKAKEAEAKEAEAKEAKAKEEEDKKVADKQTGITGESEVSDEGKTSETEKEAPVADDEEDKPKTESDKLKQQIIDMINAKGDDDIKTPADAIKQLVAMGILDKEGAEEAKKLFVKYADSDEALINSVIDIAKDQGKEITRDEAIKKLGDSIGKPIETADDVPTDTRKVRISDDTAKALVAELRDSMKWWGTDEEQFYSVLNNENLSASDKAKVIQMYNEEYGSFVTDVNNDFSGDAQSKIMDTVANALVDAAKNGDTAAIDTLCKEFYEATAGRAGTTDDFIAKVMKKADEKVLAQIKSRYSTVNEGRDLTKDIKWDFSSDVEDDYIAKFNNAVSKFGISIPDDKKVDTE